MFRKKIIGWLEYRLYKYRYNKGIKLVTELCRCTKTKKKVKLELKLLKNKDLSSIKRWLDSSEFILVDDLEKTYANYCTMYEADRVISRPSNDSGWNCKPENIKYFEERFLFLLVHSKEEECSPRPFGLDFPMELQALETLKNINNADIKNKIIEVLENSFNPPIGFYGYEMLNLDCLTQRNKEFLKIIALIKNFSKSKQIVYVKYLLYWDLLQEERDLLEDYFLNISRYDNWKYSDFLEYFVWTSQEKFSNFLINVTDKEFGERRKWIYNLLLRSDRYKFHGKHGNSKEFNGFKLKLTDQLEKNIAENISFDNAYYIVSLLRCYAPLNKKLFEESIASVGEYYDHDDRCRKALPTKVN